MPTPLTATLLSNHLSCGYLTQLTRREARGELEKPYWSDPSLDLLIQRGREHEAAYVQFLEAKGLKSTNLKRQPAERVVEAMRDGIDVIVQARLEQGSWCGEADILLKVPGKSKFGDYQYEVQDTKLTQNTRAGAILQLCLYTDLLSIVQDHTPEFMSVVTPGADFPTEKFRFADFSAYYRLIRNNLEQVMEGPDLDLYPDPVEHCGICRWWPLCNEKRHTDDHLSLVAGIRSSHIAELKRQQVLTLEQFASMVQLQKPERGNINVLIKKQAQAKVQLEGRRRKQLYHETLQLEAGRGLHRLPEPNEGDVYVDFEGDAFYPDGGLEYVIGYSYRENGELVYQKHWAINRVEEKRAFTAFMQFLIDRWKRFPNMYLYHFAPYEQTGMKRLARVHAVFESEVDDFFRAERFIDLHAVFKEALLASVESYSLKELEGFASFTREAELPLVRKARKAVEVALESNQFSLVSADTIDTVEKYNRDDVLATHALHQWLEKIRSEKIQSGQSIERPPMKLPATSEKVEEWTTKAQELYRRITGKLPEDRSTWTEEQKAMWLLAHLIDYFRREDRSAWWEYYRVHELEHEDLLEERSAITGLELVRELPKKPRQRTVTHRYRYPPQEFSIDEGDAVEEVKGESIGTVEAISLDHYTIDIKKTEKATHIHPFSIHKNEWVNPRFLPVALLDIAADINDCGLEPCGQYHASKDLLMKRSPRLVGGQYGARVLPNEDPVDAALRIAASLNQSVLAIQGPPGAGKTYTGARMIVELVKQGKKVGITAVSHKVIRHLTEAAIKCAHRQNVSISFIHKQREPEQNLAPEIIEVKDSDDVRVGLQQGKIGCGTAWLWSEDSSKQVLDYLFVDEAGQMALSQVLAASRAAKNLILLGDPQQLEQPQRGAHPEGSDVAALTYLLGGQATMPEGKGLFLPVTRRLHPSICDFTSNLFYEGRLKSLPGLEKQVLGGNTAFDGAGLFYVPVSHRGSANKSLEEVNVVVRIVDHLLGSATWTSDQGQTIRLNENDILIVAPYNAQVSALLERMPDIRIGTVDKFQGQEAPVVIYSMTSSTVEDAPKGMSFLFNPNRLNVATSRARSVCILVASPSLLQPDCRTIDQMQWANAVCAFVERSKVVGSLES